MQFLSASAAAQPDYAALEEDPQNFLLMHSIGANVSGQIASVIAGGIILSMFGSFLEVPKWTFTSILWASLSGFPIWVSVCW